MSNRAPKKKVQQITAWSFSRYNCYEQCPLKAKLQFIDKIKTPSSPAMENGLKTHNLAEDYIKGKIPELPKELELFEEEFNFLKKMFAEKGRIAVEEQWAFDEHWIKCDWFDSRRCAVRIKLDCAYIEDNVLFIDDWKTGKFKAQNAAEYKRQLDLYALGGLLTFPDVTSVVPRLAYLDDGVFYPDGDNVVTYTHDDLPRLKQEWAGRTAPMLADVEFLPKQNRFCGWCHFRKDNTENGGGQCKL
jgi:hypothetical protein